MYSKSVLLSPLSVLETDYESYKYESINLCDVNFNGISNPTSTSVTCPPSVAWRWSRPILNIQHFQLFSRWLDYRVLVWYNFKDIYWITDTPLHFIKVMGNIPVVWFIFTWIFQESVILFRCWKPGYHTNVIKWQYFRTKVKNSNFQFMLELSFFE